MRKPLALGTLSLSLVALALTAAPAQAVDGTTTVAFTVAVGTLTILPTPAGVNAPTSDVAAGVASVEINLGATVITDTRLASSGWTYSAAVLQDFAAVGGGPALPKTGATFAVPAVPTTVLGAPSYGATRQASFTGTGGASGPLLVNSGTGLNTVSLIPTMRIAIPNGTAAVAYTGTVTQSVA